MVTALLVISVLIPIVSMTTAKVVYGKSDERNLAQIHGISPVSSHPGVDDTGCQCVYTKYDCGCCVLLNFPRIDLNDTGCINVTFLPHDYGISVVFSLDGIVYYNKTVSARHPPPLCFGVPYLKQEASLCLDLYDLDFTKMTFSGCAKVTAELLHVTVGEAELGCFRIPLKEKYKNSQVDMERALQDILGAQEKYLKKLSQKNERWFENWEKKHPNWL